MMAIEPDFYSVDDLARRWDCSADTIGSLCASGALEAGIHIPGCLMCEIGKFNHELEFVRENVEAFYRYVPVTAETASHIWQAVSIGIDSISIPPLDDGRIVRVVEFVPLTPSVAGDGLKLVIPRDAVAKYEQADRVTTKSRHNEARDPANIVHSTKAKKRDTISAAIEQAQSKCKNKFDTAEVWGWLQKMALEKHPPFFGVTEDGLQRMDSDKYFTRKHLSERLKRERQRA